MKRSWILLALALTACAHDATRVEVRTVSVPVATQPIEAADVPTVPSGLPPRPSSLSTAADVLLDKVCEWVAYGLQADPLLRISAGLPPARVPTFPECEGRP